MSDFDAKWQSCAAKARDAARRDEGAPFGFATRVLAALTDRPTPSVSIEQVWQRLTWRCLAVVGSALVVCAAAEMPHLRDRKPLEPGIENTVAQIVWSL